MIDGEKLYLGLCKFGISMILMCLIWMYRMCKKKNLLVTCFNPSVFNLYYYK
jgi:hypothetical protein